MRWIDARRTAAALVAVGLFSVSGELMAEDCNRNGVDDVADIREGTSPDCNLNGLPDECEQETGIVTFHPREGILSGILVDSLVVEDLDGDGDADVASAGDDILVALNRGDGTFDEPTRYAVGVCSWDMASADLDGDGDYDLVAVCYEWGDVPVLLNRGDGIFDVEVRELVFERSRHPHLADFDGDGDADMLVRSSHALGASLLRNDGSGAFGEAEFIPAGARGPFYAVSDLNGDGAPDLALSNSDSSESPDYEVVVLLNSGDGTFPGTERHALGGRPAQLAAADLDGDGDRDLAVAVPDADTVALFVNTGDGTFTAIPELSVTGVPQSILVADLDADGDPDIVTAGAGGFDEIATLSILKNRGDATFDPAARHELPDKGITSRLLDADLDSDQLPEVILGLYSPGGVAVFQNLGGGEVDDPAVFSTVFGGMIAVEARDIDGDRDLDLITGHLNLVGGVSMLRNATGQAISIGCAEFQRGDVNADGVVSISDMIMIRRFLFGPGVDLPCHDAADVSDNETISFCDFFGILYVLFLDEDWSRPIAEPFPTPGPDPTVEPSDSALEFCGEPAGDPGSRLGCVRYDPQPAQATADILRIGDVEAIPGQEVRIPVFLTTSVPVEAIQLVLEYDTDVLEIERNALDFEDTYYERFNAPDTAPRPEIAVLTSHPGSGVLTAGIAGSVVASGFEVAPGNDILVAWIVARVPDGVPGDTVVTVSPTNGEGGRGVGPFGMRNELTHLGEARYLSLLPRMVAGSLKIVGDQSLFIRGDTNGDWEVDVSDAVHTLEFLFRGGKQLLCPDAADADDNGIVELTDAVFFLGSLYRGEGAIPPPYPGQGRDRTSDPLRCYRPARGG